jgi:hypothetical protein
MREFEGLRFRIQGVLPQPPDVDCYAAGFSVCGRAGMLGDGWGR